MIFYLILFSIFILAIILEQKDYNCSFENTNFFDLGNSKWIKNHIIKQTDDTKQSFKKIYDSLENNARCPTWRKYFFIAFFSAILITIFTKRSLNDDWFVFICTLIIFFVSFVIHAFYKWHIEDEVTKIIKSNITQIKQRVFKNDL
jgi:hypothetical protein